MPANETSSTPVTLIDCTTAVQRMWDFLDGELDAARVREIEGHLAACQRCPSHFAFARSLLESIATARAGLEEPGALRSRVLAALQEEGFRRSGGS
jgi:anti-sigma factor (TIGR02949 family)